MKADKNSQMDPMEEDDPILYWAIVNWIMEDDSTPDDEQQDDGAEDFQLLFRLLREQSAATGTPPNVLSYWDYLFSEVALLDDYGNRY
jgi:hypothetical protein